jgi:Domain of unknown function (DUF1883)
MKYLHRILKLKKGMHIKVHFNQPTKILLLGDFQYKNYKDHRTYEYRGGEMAASPQRFVIPNDGLWHVVVERGGYFHPKNIVANVEVEN